MNTVLWVAQTGLAVIFIYAGITNLIAFQRHGLTTDTGFSSLCFGDSPATTGALGFAEILGALGLLVPFGTLTPYFVVQLSAGALALLMLAAIVYHARRREHTSPILALFFLALFVIVGRMP